MDLQNRMSGVQAAGAGPADHAYRFEFDPYELEGFVGVAAKFEQDRFGYVVTPNVDHLIRLHDSQQFRELYKTAAYVLLDSRLLSRLLHWFRRQRFPVCTGSDLTRVLFERVIAPHDRIVLIGSSGPQANVLRERFGLTALAHYNPPMGFLKDPQEVERCLEFVETHSPSRFCLLAVGSPQQEVLAHALQLRGKASGLALCIGASIDFLTGVERRAPLWMQRYGLEWLHRLAQDPGRLAKRYLGGAPRLFGLLLWGQFLPRGTGLAPQAATPGLPGLHETAD